MTADGAITERADKTPVLAQKQPGPQPVGKPSPKPGPVRRITIEPVAKPAKMRWRHWGVVFSFLLFAIAPLGAFGVYLWGISLDRYASTVGFTVRQEEGPSATDIFGIVGLTGSVSGDGDILYEFIRSQDVVDRIDQRLGLRAYFAEYWGQDPLFALWPEATIEDLHWYWRRTVRVSYDQSTGLTDLRVVAFDPEMAQAIAREILSESQSMVNALNEAARNDAIRYANSDLEQAETRLKEVRERLTEFRVRTQIVDLEADIQGRMGVTNNLQQQLAQELVAFDELSSTTNVDDPRIVQALRRINVIRERIVEERRNFATNEVQGTGEDYPTLISEFQGLVLESTFAEEAYRAGLAARDSALANADRQTRYLATYVSPTKAESSQYPQRGLIFGMAALLLVLSWSIVVLIYYAIRDRA